MRMVWDVSLPKSLSSTIRTRNAMAMGVATAAPAIHIPPIISLATSLDGLALFIKLILYISATSFNIMQRCCGFRTLKILIQDKCKTAFFEYLLQMVDLDGISNLGKRITSAHLDLVIRSSEYVMGYLPNRIIISKEFRIYFFIFSNIFLAKKRFFQSNKIVFQSSSNFKHTNNFSNSWVITTITDEITRSQSLSIWDLKMVASLPKTFL